MTSLCIIQDFVNLGRVRYQVNLLQGRGTDFHYYVDAIAGTQEAEKFIVDEWINLVSIKNSKKVTIRIGSRYR